MGAPVLSLPERVELLVGHQPALRAAGLGRIPGIARGAVGCHLAAPAPRVLGLDTALALLALELRSVDALGPVDPASEPGDRGNLALDLGLPEPHRVGRRQLAREERKPVRVADPDDRVRPLAKPPLHPHGAVVDLDTPGPASLADQLVGDREAVPARPLGLDRVREGAEDEVGIHGVAEAGQVAGPGVGIESAQRHCLAPATAQLQPSAHQRPDRVPAGGDPGECLGVGGDRKCLSVEIGAGEDLGHLGAAAEGTDGPGAEAVELEPIAHALRQFRRGRGQGLEDQSRRELRVGLRHPAQRPLCRPVRSVAVLGHAFSSVRPVRRFCQTAGRIWPASQERRGGRGERAN